MARENRKSRALAKARGKESMTYWCEACGYKHSKTSKIGQAHAKGVRRREPTFNQEYNRLIDTFRRRGLNQSMMSKRVPKYAADILAAANKSPNEWHAAIDFELRDDDPERILMNRGQQYQVQPDSDDFELSVHTHPPPVKGGTGFRATMVPSAPDVARATIDMPQLISVRDESGMGRFILVRSTRLSRAPKDVLDKLAKTFDDLIRKYPYPFPTRHVRDQFTKEWRQSVNKEGYDFKTVRLHETMIHMRRDFSPERTVRVPRKNAFERAVLEGARLILPSCMGVAAGNQGTTYWVQWDGKRTVGENDLITWAKKYNLVLVDSSGGKDDDGTRFNERVYQVKTK